MIVRSMLVHLGICNNLHLQSEDNNFLNKRLLKIFKIGMLFLGVVFSVVVVGFTGWQ